jgi:hypothetical protein
LPDRRAAVSLIPTLRLPRLRLSLVKRFEQFFRPTEQRIGLLRSVIANAGRIGRNQMGLAVLAHDPSAKVLDPNL